jgi:hypothetical protein
MKHSATCVVQQAYYYPDNPFPKTDTRWFSSTGNPFCFIHLVLLPDMPSKPVSQGGAPLLRDLRHAFRALLRKPGLELIAVVTMALGIGATSAIFTVADAILWKSLPLPDAGRVVMLFERRVEMKSGWIPVSPGDFVDWKQQSRSYERVAAYQYSTHEWSFSMNR